MRSKFLNGLLSSRPLCHFVFLAVTHTQTSVLSVPQTRMIPSLRPLWTEQNVEKAALVLTLSWSLINSGFAFTFYCANSASRFVLSPTHSLLPPPTSR